MKALFFDLDGTLLDSSKKIPASAVEALLAGTLQASDAPNCSHHDAHHGADHVCGEHGCGEDHDCHCHH